MPRQTPSLTERESRNGATQAMSLGVILPQLELRHQAVVVVEIRTDVRHGETTLRKCLQSCADSRSFSSQSTDPGPTPLSPHSAANPPIRQSAARWQPSDAYDDPSPPIRTGSVTRVEVGGRRSPAVGSPGVGSPDKGGASVGKIDPGGLGMRPR